ncbi:MAG TPA: hypothetical protein VN625_11240 [Desulfuromonadaceae bacterium]|nr:hypothetical protein [Desulfuromonadaceae bacterium]
MRTVCAIVLFAFLASAARAGIVLDFWHPYTPLSTGEKHYGFHLAKYKRGLFFGSCGFSTYSQQWAYTLDLQGDGPVYDINHITLSDDLPKPVKTISGRIIIDEKQTSAVITLDIEKDGVTNHFIGNGTYKIRKLD